MNELVHACLLRVCVVVVGCQVMSRNLRFTSWPRAFTFSNTPQTKILLNRNKITVNIQQIYKVSVSRGLVAYTSTVRVWNKVRPSIPKPYQPLLNSPLLWRSQHSQFTAMTRSAIEGSYTVMAAASCSHFWNDNITTLSTSVALIGISTLVDHHKCNIPSWLFFYSFII